MYDDSAPGQAPQSHLNWGNVSIGFAFILIDATLSLVLGLQIGGSLLTAAVRCVIQLTVMGLVLQSVFEAQNIWAVAGISCLLVLLGTFETVANKSKRRFQHMFPSVLIAIASSTIPVAIVGSRFAMGYIPFWEPANFIPVLGMLCGSTISGIVVAVSYVLRELKDNRDKAETYLAFGASRFEACRGIAIEALRLALLPTINQMSVIGLISIPGMMTGSILGGASVDQAAKLQMVIMFMISASTALASMIASTFALSIVCDNQHRIRSDRILSEKHIVWRTRDNIAEAILNGAKHAGTKLRTKFTRSDTGNGITEPLLGH